MIPGTLTSDVKQRKQRSQDPNPNNSYNRTAKNHEIQKQETRVTLFATIEQDSGVN